MSCDSFKKCVKNIGKAVTSMGRKRYETSPLLPVMETEPRPLHVLDKYTTTVPLLQIKGVLFLSLKSILFDVSAGGLRSWRELVFLLPSMHVLWIELRLVLSFAASFFPGWVMLLPSTQLFIFGNRKATCGHVFFWHLWYIRCNRWMHVTFL